MDRRRLLPWALSGVLGLALFATIGHRTAELPSANAAPVLQRLRALGELHTARFEYSDVVDHGTYQKPDGLLAALPGSDALARATTSNSALVKVKGSVEAGVDLGKLRAESTPTGLRLTLPKPVAYKPEVDAKLFSVKRGLFWQDDSVALGAVDEAKGRISSAALRQGLLENARKEAETRVRTLAESFGAKVAEVRFGDA